MTEIKQLSLSPKEELNALCNEINFILTNILEAFRISPDNSVSFNSNMFRIDIEIGDNKYHIYLQGRGIDIDKYHEALLEIIKSEITPK